LTHEDDPAAAHHAVHGVEVRGGGDRLVDAPPGAQLVQGPRGRTGLPLRLGEHGLLHAAGEDDHRRHDAGEHAEWEHPPLAAPEHAEEEEHDRREHDGTDHQRPQELVLLGLDLERLPNLDALLLDRLPLTARASFFTDVSYSLLSMASVASLFST